MSDAPRTGNEACAYYRQQITSGSTAWLRRCLALARIARGLPAVYPTANAAALATPKAERVHDIGALRRGMVVYYGTPDDDNPADHIGTVAGWQGNKITGKLADLLVLSNDVVAGKPGAVGLVHGDYFPRNWGDPLMFGATWLNGYNFADLDAGKVIPPRNPLGSDFDAAEASLRKAIRRHRESGHTRIVAALSRDLAEMVQTRREFGV